jgi:hypothetical protein
VRTAPSAATFRRIINATDPTVWDEALSAWAAGPAASEPATSGQARPTVSGVSLDGKTMRGAKMFDAAGAMTQAAVLEALEALEQSPSRGGRMATRPKSTTTYPWGFGGGSLAEIAVPILVFQSPGGTAPTTWRPAHRQEPSWWATGS